ncbi:hypothetical protein [Aeromicrobium sp.]|uniref:hypothetical protein n=1 Tax=Aeromicrobium sp. TaxID=1871063 RepID=UPI002FCA6DE9
MSANDESAEWEWSDGRPLPTTVYIDSAMSQHMGDVFVKFTQYGTELGIFVTANQWVCINDAALRAIEHRRALTQEGWT